jgi:hypothetical protein
MKQEHDLEVRRLRSFTDLYATLWDLYTRQAELRKTLVDMNEEFTRKVPRSRLILYLKRKDSSFEYSALHWGFTIPGLKSSPAGAGGRRRRRIKHISTPLNDSVIHCGGGDSRRKLFYDFDRRRLAANGGYKKVTKAITTIRQLLKSRAGRGPGATPEAPLPSRDALGPISGEALETASWAWRLLAGILEKEMELLRLTREYEVSPADSRVGLVFAPTTPDREVSSAHWILPNDAGPCEKLTYAQIRSLHIPEAHQKVLSRFERARRSVLTALSRDVKRLARLAGVSPLALRLGDEAIVEAHRREVDDFGRPLTQEREVG